MATRLGGAAALNPLLLFSPSPSSSSSPFLSIPHTLPSSSVSFSHFSTTHRRRPSPKFVCRRAKVEYNEYKFPDPIPEFAEAETSKFRDHMMKRLTQKKEYFGEHVEEIVDICTEILRTFLSTEYGGPGTLLVDPFADMDDAIREKGLPGAPRAARAAIGWAEKNIDKDWKEWTGED